MPYIVTRNILDTKDNNYFYEAGDAYPRPDMKVSDKRIKELLDKGVIQTDDAEGNTALDNKKETDLSVKELKAKLDELGIQYSSRASKDELQSLLDGDKGE